MIYVINGSAGSGKDTFCEMTSRFVGEEFVKVFSTVDIVKTLAIEAGWDGKKTPRARKFLSDLKDLLTDWNDTPYKSVSTKILLTKNEWESYGIDTSKCAIFVMCREPQEIKKFVEKTLSLNLYKFSGFFICSHFSFLGLIEKVNVASEF